MKLQVTNVRTGERSIVAGEDAHVEAKLRLMYPSATDRIPEGYLGNVIHAVAKVQDVGLLPLEGTLPAPVRDLPEDLGKAEKKPHSISEQIRSLGLRGFGGACFDCAHQINQKVFGGRGKLVGAANTFWLSRGRFIGHVAVQHRGKFWDGDAVPKQYEDVESWGMLDPEDPDYHADGWNEEAANEVTRLDGHEAVHRAWTGGLKKADLAKGDLVRFPYSKVSPAQDLGKPAPVVGAPIRNEQQESARAELGAIYDRVGEIERQQNATRKFDVGSQVLHVDREHHPWPGRVGLTRYRDQGENGPGHYYEVEWQDPKGVRVDFLHQSLLTPHLTVAKTEGDGKPVQSVLGTSIHPHHRALLERITHAYRDLDPALATSCEDLSFRVASVAQHFGVPAHGVYGGAECPAEEGDDDVLPDGWTQTPHVWVAVAHQPEQVGLRHYFDPKAVAWNAPGAHKKWPFGPAKPGELGQYRNYEVGHDTAGGLSPPKPEHLDELDHKVIAMVGARMKKPLAKMEGQTYGDGTSEYHVPALAQHAAQHYPVTQVPVEHLKHVIEEAHTDEPWGSPEFHARAMRTDLKHPLIVVQHPEGMHIADGMHRFYRHIQNGATHVPAYVVPHDKLPAEAMVKSEPQPPTQVSLDDAHKQFKVFRILHDGRIPGLRGDRYLARPGIPTIGGVEGEDRSTPRVSVARTIHQAASGLLGWTNPQDWDLFEWSHLEGRRVYGVRQFPKGHVPNAKVQAKVPDAKLTGEEWLTEPTEMEYVGHIALSPPEEFAEGRAPPVYLERRDPNVFNPPPKWKKVYGTLGKSEPASGSMTIRFMRNTERAGNFGSRFAQDVEPHGTYMLEAPETFDPAKAKGWESGTVTFQNPLHIEWGGGYQDPTNWKHVLSARFGGKRGKALSQAILAAGHDAVVTHDQHGTNEIVHLAPLRKDETVPQEYAYHVTHASRLDSIRQQGLLPQRHAHADSEPVIFVEPDEEEAAIYHGRDTHMLRFPVPGFGTLENGENVHYDRVPPEHIEIKTTRGWTKLK